MYPQYQIYLPAWIYFLYMFCDPFIALHEWSMLPSEANFITFALNPSTLYSSYSFLLYLLDYFPPLLDHSYHQSCGDISHFK